MNEAKFHYNRQHVYLPLVINTECKIIRKYKHVFDNKEDAQDAAILLRKEIDEGEAAVAYGQVDIQGTPYDMKIVWGE